MRFQDFCIRVTGDHSMSSVVGLAVNKDGVLYIADGVTVRKVDERGAIGTVIGSQSPTSWRPLLCYQTLSALQVCACRRKLTITIRDVDTGRVLLQI